MRYWVVAAVMLGGCTQVPSAPVAGPTGDCKAQAWVALVGQPVTSALVVPQPKRSYRLGDPVTTDFQPERVNFVLDGTDTITDITCG